MDASPDGQGYLSVELFKDGIGLRRKVHLMVAEAFHGARPENCVCRHLNGNNQDNRIHNLKWGTPDENREDMKSHGTRLTGERNPASKLTEMQVLEIKRRLGIGEVGRKLANEFKVSATVICNIRKNRVWRNIISPEK